MFFPYHLVGPSEVENFMQQWLDELGAATVPDGAPDCRDLQGDLLEIGPLAVTWTATSRLHLHLVVDVNPERPAEPVLLSAHLMRDGRAAWRYCRNDHHSDVGGDHLHLDDDARLVGLVEPLALSHITARLLAEPR